MRRTGHVVSDAVDRPHAPVPLRVLLVTGEYPPMRGGIGDYSALLQAALLQQGIDVWVLTSTKAATGGPAAPAASHVPVLPHVASWDFRCWAELEAAIAVAQPDVVHVQYQAGAFDLHPAIPLWPLRRRFRRPRPKIVVTFHDLRVPYLFPKAGPLRHLVILALAVGADRAIVTNEEDAVRLRWLGTRVRRIPIGSNIPVVPCDEQQRQAVRRRFGVTPDELLLGYFGFLTPTKGVDLLLRALPQLEQLGIRPRLLMIGGGAGESAASNLEYDCLIRGMAEAPERKGKVLWTGFLTPEEVSVTLQAIDLCVLPYREGASFRHGTLAAALVHGLPIVTTLPPLPGPSNSLLDGTHVALVPPDDPQELAHTIARLARDPKQRTVLAHGAARLGKQFRWGQIAARTVALYRDVLGLDGIGSEAS